MNIFYGKGITILLLVIFGTAFPNQNPANMSEKKTNIIDSLAQEKKIDAKFDSLSKVYNFHSIEESNYRAVIDNLGSAYAPLSIATAVLGLFIGILGVLSAFGIYLLGLRKDREVSNVIEAKHNEINRIIAELKENQKQEMEETLRFIKSEEERRNSSISTYQEYLKSRMEELKENIHKSQSEDKSKLKLQMDELQEKILKAPMTYSYGTSGMTGVTGIPSGNFNFGTGTSFGYDIHCTNCGINNRVKSILSLYAGSCVCEKCGKVLSPP